VNVAVVDPIGARGLPVVATVAGLTRYLTDARARGASVGLVPTMGALHAGHLSLIARAVAECDVVAVSVFVNPLQFGDADDLAHYPRALDADLDQAAAAGATVAFAPPVEEMYPDGPGSVATIVSVRDLGDRWEGAARPGHFDGVATVVTKLFAMAGPCRAYFGEKDFQQLAIVSRLARDLSFPVEVVGCPTIREPDGLARSSRNARLSPSERAAAAVLPRALRAGFDAMAEGEYRPAMVESRMVQVVEREPLARLDYAALVRAADLTPVPSLLDGGPFRLLVAARVGPVRLIDNLDPGDNLPLELATGGPAGGTPETSPERGT